MDMTEYLTIKHYLEKKKAVHVGGGQFEFVISVLLKKLKKDLQEEKTSHLFVT